MVNRMHRAVDGLKRPRSSSPGLMAVAANPQLGEVDCHAARLVLGEQVRWARGCRSKPVRARGPRSKRPQGAGARMVATERHTGLLYFLLAVSTPVASRGIHCG